MTDAFDPNWNAFGPTPIEAFLRLGKAQVSELQSRADLPNAFAAEAPESPRSAPESPRSVPESSRSVPESPRSVPESPQKSPKVPESPHAKAAQTEAKSQYRLNNPQQEAFCDALARGYSPREAGGLAGYKNLKKCAALARRPDMIARTEHLRRELAWEASGDLNGVFAQLREVVGGALAGKDPRGVAAAIAGLKLTAELKAKIRDLPDDFGLAENDDHNYTEEEWEARHGLSAPKT